MLHAYPPERIVSSNLTARYSSRYDATIACPPEQPDAHVTARPSFQLDSTIVAPAALHGRCSLEPGAWSLEPGV